MNARKAGECMATVTILTPTYNRRTLLERLYRSLCAQTCDDFVWLIADDGSDDGTDGQIARWAEEAPFPVRSFYKENGGKHTAVNRAVPRIDTPLTAIVDSDDVLLPDAVETVRADYARFDMAGVCAIAYRRMDGSGAYLSSRPVPRDGMRESFCRCRYGRGIRGDMAEVFVTRCLREYPFPEYPGEKFCSEGVSWVAMSGPYEMIFRNQAIVMGGYAPGGLTGSRRRLSLSSPRGCVHRAQVHLAAGLPLRDQCRAMMVYAVYGRAAGMSVAQLLRGSRRRGLYLLLALPAEGLYRYWRRREKT